MGVSARSLESVGALTDGAAVCGVLPCLSLMESSFLDSMEGVTPKQQTMSIMSNVCNVKNALNLQDLRETLGDSSRKSTIKDIRSVFKSSGPSG